MNKYINEIEKSNSFIKAFINEFNKVLLKEKIKNTKGRIKTRTIKDHYVNKLFNYKEFKKYTISQSLSGISFELRKLNQFNDVENGLFIHRANFEISKKNNEVKLESISFRNILDKKNSIDYSLSVDSEKKDLILSLVLGCNETANEKLLSIDSNKVKMYDLPRNGNPSKEFELNKKILDVFEEVAKVNKEIFFDFLFLGKDLDKEMIDLLSISYDIDWKNKNVFRINIKDKESKLTNNEKLKP